MTDDFVADLERQLHAAVVRRRRSGVRSRARGGAVAVAGLLAAVVVAGAWLTRSGDEGPDGGPPSASGSATVALAVPAAAPAVACASRDQRAIPATGALGRAGLGILTGSPDAAAAEALGDGDLSWLPASSVLPEEARVVRAPGGTTDLILVPTLEVLDHECGPGRPKFVSAGVCLVADPHGERDVRCFTTEEVASGRAVAVTAADAGGVARVHGVVPDGVERVALDAQAGGAEAAVGDNVYELRVAGLAAGDRVQLTFTTSAPRAPCEPSPGLLRAVPAVAEGEAPPFFPEQLVTVVGVDRELVDRWARIWDQRDGLTFWLVPQLRCDLVTQNDRACIAVVADFVEGTVCAGADEIGERGRADWFPIAGRPVMAGFAPTDAVVARVRAAGHADRRFPVRGGVFAGTLPPDVPMDRHNAYRLTFEP